MAGSRCQRRLPMVVAPFIGSVLALWPNTPRACAVAAGPRPVGTVRVVDRQHADDMVGVEAQGERLIVRVASSRGIGHCTLAAEGGRWPTEITLVFAGLRELEDFELTSGGLRAQGSRRDTGRVPAFAVPTTAGAAPTDAATDATGTLDIRIEKDDAGVRVILPANLLRDEAADRAKVRWVDWLRR